MRRLDNVRRIMLSMCWTIPVCKGYDKEGKVVWHIMDRENYQSMIRLLETKFKYHRTTLCPKLGEVCVWYIRKEMTDV